MIQNFKFNSRPCLVCISAFAVVFTQMETMYDPEWRPYIWFAPKRQEKIIYLQILVWQQPRKKWSTQKPFLPGLAQSKNHEGRQDPGDKAAAAAAPQRSDHEGRHDGKTRRQRQVWEETNVQIQPAHGEVRGPNRKRSFEKRTVWTPLERHFSQQATWYGWNQEGLANKNGKFASRTCAK